MSTYSQIYIHVVFAVRGRRSLISESWEEQLYKYITGIVTQKHHKLISIGGIADHIHILIGLKPAEALSDLVREIKKSSNEFINRNHFVNERFVWQEGYGAFSCCHNQLDTIINYIRTQKDHHKSIKLNEEYVNLLKEYNIQYEEKYLFDQLDSGTGSNDVL